MEYDLQREGLARALADPEIARILLRTPPVALYVFEWSSASMQRPLLSDWVVVETYEDLGDVIGSLRNASEAHRHAGTTGLGSALAYAGRKLASAPRCHTQTVDVSGDGRNNTGISPSEVYADPQYHGITVNALVVEGGQTNTAIYGRDVGLVQWFKQNVIRGPGAFVIVANGYIDYQRAMKVKLLRELDSVTISGLRLAD